LNQNRAINFLKYIFAALLTAPLLSFALDKPRDMTTKHQEHNNSEGFKTAESNATLKHAIETIIHKSYRVKQAKERITQAKHSKDEAFGEFLPQVSVSATATKKDSKGYEELDYRQMQGDATLSYNLFSSGMHVAGYQKANLTQKEQEEKLKGVLEEEILKGIDAYYSVLYGKLAIDANKRNFEKLREVLEIVKIKKDLGAASAGDEGSIMASVSNAKTALINTESMYNNAKDYYEFLTDTKTELLLPYETAPEIKLKSFDEIFDEIKTANTDLSIVKTQIKGKQKEVTLTRAMDLPKLDLVMTNSRKYRRDILDPTMMGHNRGIAVELTLSYNLYTGGKSEAKVARLMSEVSGLVFNLEYLTKETKWNSQKLFNSVTTNTKALESLDMEIGASEKMANAYWEKFRLSSQDLVTLLQAQRQLNAAELEKLKSEKARIVDYFNLLAKRGKLLEYFGL